MIRGSGGLRPFQRGIIWSINSIKYMYNDLVRRNGDIENLILLHQDNQSNLFRCLDMDRLSYTVIFIHKLFISSPLNQLYGLKYFEFKFNQIILGLR